MTIRWKDIGLGVLIGAVATWVSVSYRAHTAAGRNQGTVLRIGDLAQRIRNELEQMEAQRTASGTDAVFQLKDFDLEISFVVKTSQKAKGEVSAEVVTIGSDTEAGRENAQKVTLHMTPIAMQKFSTPPTAGPIDESGAIKLPPAEVK